LKVNLPVKSGELNAWKFEKAHSILHKVRELLLFGWSENVSTQGPEHCHNDVCKKKLAACTNNKDACLTILRDHVREGHLQYLQKLQADLADEDSEEVLPKQSAEELLQAVGRRRRGRQDIDIHLLKPSEVFPRARIGLASN
jgi:hypothetical protein